MRIQRMAALVVLSVLAVVGSPVATMANAAAPPGGSALAPVSPAAYAELSAKWWQWAASTPFTDAGPFGQASTDCGENQPQGVDGLADPQISAAHVVAPRPSVAGREVHRSPGRP
jgi:hypothetical protein